MLQVLKNRNFFLIITGKFISLMGNSIFDIAVIWYILSKYGKGSGTMLALVMLMAILPTVLLGSFAGSLIDRYNKKYIMIISDLFAGGCVFIIFLLMKNDLLNSLIILGVTGIMSITSATVRIAVNSLIPEMFKGKEHYDANGINQFAERGTALLGFALGGGLIALVGVENAILLNGISFIICVLFEVFLKLKVIQGSADNRNKTSLIKDFGEVKTFLKSNRVLLRVMLVFTIVNFLLDPLLNIVLPYVLKYVFDVNSTNFGIIIAALPLGFCVGAVLFSKKPGFLLNKFVLFNSILIINTISVIFSLPIIFSVYFATNKFVTIYFILCLFSSGIFSAAINISASTQLQRNVPDNIRGKFMGISSSLTSGLLPIGSLIAGDLIGLVSPSFIYIFSIAAIFLVIIIIPKKSYCFRNVESKAEAG
jgi:DHA3 family macrolide efflux protein-like MFS transporter